MGPSDGDPRDKMMIGVFVLLFVVFTAWSIYHCSGEYTVEEVIIKEYPIYHCTAPFGVIWIEESASGTFILFIGAYSSSSELTETYNVKAFDDDELFTMMFDATQVRVVSDGEFYLEETTITTKTFSRGGRETNCGRGPRSHITYLIHIPELPRLNQTISMEWTYVGS